MNHVSKNNKLTWWTTVIFLQLPITLFFVFFLPFFEREFAGAPIPGTIFRQFILLFGFVLGMLAVRGKVKWWILTLGFAIIYFAVDWILNTVSLGEFDAFFIQMGFQLAFFTFLSAFFLTWSLLKGKIGMMINILIYLMMLLFLLTHQTNLNGFLLLRITIPFLLLIAYTIYLSTIFKDVKAIPSPAFIIKRGIVGIVISIFIALIFPKVGANLVNKTIDKFAHDEVSKDGALTEKNKDGTIKVKQKSTLTGERGKSKTLLFAAYIDYFMEEDGTPIPLYMTSFYYSKYDSKTQTFERDTFLPENDLFAPELDTIPLYKVVTDSSVLKKTKDFPYQKDIKTEVYKVNLDKKEYTAPITAYQVENIAISPEEIKQFYAGFVAHSKISALNNAFFVYNADNPSLLLLQEQRYKILSSVKNYAGEDKAFLDYYTIVPKDTSFNKIKELSLQIAKDQAHPIDKVVAVRNYFRQRDAAGKRIFKYSDNPGEPDIPNANKLNHFLFESKNGYCAYYAGTAQMMLRYMGIPSRIAVGFLPIDRSTKENRGWYWFYEDQSHAWVQVYFPEYGWMDFDFTVGNDEPQNAPQPDGTPPSKPKVMIWAMKGAINSIDTIHKTMNINTKELIFKNENIKFSSIETKHINLKSTQIVLDTAILSIKDLKVADSVTLVSFQPVEKEKILNETNIENTDVVYITRKTELQKNNAVTDTVSTIKKYSKNFIYILMGLVMVAIIGFPYLKLKYLKYKVKFAKINTSQKLFDYTFYYLQSFEKEPFRLDKLSDFGNLIDQKYQVDYTKLIIQLQKNKYRNTENQMEDKQWSLSYLATFDKKMKPKFTLKQKLNAWTILSKR